MRVIVFVACCHHHFVYLHRIDCCLNLLDLLSTIVSIHMNLAHVYRQCKRSIEIRSVSKWSRHWHTLVVSTLCWLTDWNDMRFICTRAHHRYQTILSRDDLACQRIIFTAEIVTTNKRLSFISWSIKLEKKILTSSLLKQATFYYSVRIAIKMCNKPSISTDQRLFNSNCFSIFIRSIHWLCT
jgi:hypothetical protein